jgi:hypothetical protein
LMRALQRCRQMIGSEDASLVVTSWLHSGHLSQVVFETIYK